MKRLSICLIIVVLVMMTSCYTHQKFIVNGIPGTVIADMNNTTLAVVDQSGTAEIKLRRSDGYYAFLQAKVPNSDKVIPFALDYQDKNRSKTNCNLAFLFAIPPFYPLGILGPWWVFGCQMGTRFDYDYLDYQHTNNDLIK